MYITQYYLYLDITILLTDTLLPGVVPPGVFVTPVYLIYSVVREHEGSWTPYHYIAEILCRVSLYDGVCIQHGNWGTYHL